MLIISVLMISDDEDANQEGMEALNAEYTCGRVARVFAKARPSSEHNERPRTKSEDSETFTRDKVESRQVSLSGWIERIAMTLVTPNPPIIHLTLSPPVPPLLTMRNSKTSMIQVME